MTIYNETKCYSRNLLKLYSILQTEKDVVFSIFKNKGYLQKQEDMLLMSPTHPQDSPFQLLKMLHLSLQSSANSEEILAENLLPKAMPQSEA